MKSLLTIAYVASALLPAIGLIGLYRFAALDARALFKAGHTPEEGIRGGTLTHLAQASSAAIVARPKRVLLDLVLIGGGVTLGAGASIVALFI